MRRRRTQVLAALVVVLLAGGGYALWAWTRPSATTSTRTVDYTVSSQTVQQTVSASGTLSAAKEADLSFAVSGTIDAVRVKVGQTVKAGQVLATVADSELAAQNSSAQAQLSSAEAAYSADVSAGASSAQLASDSAQVQSAVASATQARASLADAELRSTISGTVAAVNIEVGDQASSSSGGSGGSGGGNGGAGSGASNASNAPSSSGGSSSSAQIVVVQPGTFVVDTSVGGADVASIRPGMQAQLSVSGSAATIFGTVSSVGMVASTSSSGTQATFPVTIAVTGAQKNLYVGTSVTVSIITKQLSNVLAVPSLALSTSNGTTTVEKLVNGSPVKVPVKVGQTYGAQTQITAGLKSGDQIQLTLGFNRVSTSGNGTGGSGRTGRFGGSGGGFGGGFGGGGGGGFTTGGAP